MYGQQKDINDALVFVNRIFCFIYESDECIQRDKIPVPLDTCKTECNICLLVRSLVRSFVCSKR